MYTTTLQPEPSAAMQIVQGEKRLAQSKVTVGFDGFIDILVKPIAKTSQDPDRLRYFKTIEEFGNFLSSHKGVSCSVETQILSRKFGGNAPLLSNALSYLGVPVDCIGTFGKDTIDPVFLNLPCRLYSFDDAGISTALEFTDGKVLLGERISKRPDWDAILACTSQAGLEKLICSADLLALVNWSEISYSYDLWKAVLENYLVRQDFMPDRFVFFDLCDISRKSADDVLQILKLIQAFSACRKTVLSMNRNEMNLTGKILGCTSYERTAEKLRREFSVYEVIVHGYDGSMLVTQQETCLYQNQPVLNPAILTGAGDNFNGAYCAATLLGMQAHDRLWFAAKFAEEYVKNGIPSTIEDMKCFAERKIT